MRPLLRSLNQEQAHSLFKSLELLDIDTFIAFLKRQGVAQLWLQFLLEQDQLPATLEAVVDDLKQAAINTAASQLMQRKVLKDVRDTFTGAGIEYLVFKGANLRHTIYADPTQRPVCDVDILVRDESKLDAVRTLLQADFVAEHKAENISHETSLHKHGVWIDLHWHLLRPGRTRIDLNDYLFDQAQAFGEEKIMDASDQSGDQARNQEFIGLSNEASLLVMLIHPAITKYVNGSFSSLMHLVDIHHLARKEDINWPHLVDTLRVSGTATAAWASLVWLQMLADQPILEDLSARLEPGNLKAKWLRYWLRNNLNVKYVENTFLIRSCFSLVLQDRLTDSITAMVTLNKARKESTATLQSFKNP